MITVKVNKEYYVGRANDGHSRTITLPGGFQTELKGGKLGMVKPVDRYTGQPIPYLTIEDSLELDPENNPNDKINLGFILACKKKLVDWNLNSLLVIEDPNSKEQEEFRKSQRLANLTMALHSKVDEEPFLRTLYRRLIGKDDGLSARDLFTKLSIEATRIPERFYEEDGTFIWEDEEYEATNLVYNLLNEGFFREDSLGAILDNDNMKVANNVKGAAKALMTDAKLMSKAKSFVNTPKQIEPIINTGTVDSIYSQYELESGIETEDAITAYDELEIDVFTGEVNRDKLEAIATDNLAEFLERGLIDKTGVRKNTKYQIYEIPEETFNNKETLLKFLANNEAVLRSLLSQLKR